MKYFLHDVNSFNDDKVTLLFMKFGYEAVGLFYVILEKLALQEKPIDEIVLKSQLKIKKRLTKQLNFMYEIGILSVQNGEVFSINILKNTENYQEKKEKNRKKVSEWREKQDNTKNVTGTKPVRNRPNISKVNISKVNIITLKEGFDFFFKNYYKYIKKQKGHEKAAFEEYKNLTEIERDKALANLTNYSQTKPENEHRYLATCKNYLAGKLFNNEFEKKETKESRAAEMLKEYEKLQKK